MNAKANAAHYAALLYAHSLVTADWREATARSIDTNLTADARKFYKGKAAEFRAEMRDISKKLKVFQLG